MQTYCQAKCFVQTNCLAKGFNIGESSYYFHFKINFPFEHKSFFEASLL